MIIEDGVVKSIEPTGAWIETIRQSTCQSCKARAGCGQRMLSELAGETTLVFALFESAKPPLLSVGQSVKIGVPREVVALGSLSIYVLPIVCLILMTLLFDKLTNSDLGAAIGGLLGLVMSAFILMKQAKKHRCNPKINPVIIDK